MSILSFTNSCSIHSHTCLLSGDYAVKDVGVIPEPEVKEFVVGADDKFMIMASDGVWEFITSQVHENPL